MHVYRRADSQIQAPLDSVFAIELDANPTTGFDWQLDIDGLAVTLRSQQFIRKSARVGAGGVRRFELAAGAVGTSTLTFQLKRSWTPSATDAHTVVVTVSPT